MFHVFYDDVNVILNIWHWIRTINQFKFISLCWSYYFKFIIFVLLPCFFPFVINRFKLWRGTCLFKLIKSNPCNKLRTNVCGSLVLLLSVFMNIFPCLYLDNNWLISFCIAFLARNLLCFMIKPTSWFRLLWTFIDRLKWFLVQLLLQVYCL